MKAKELMSRVVKTCELSTTLSAAALLMREEDCGILPVIDKDRKVIGVITDRDICLALTSKYRLASEVPVEEILHRRLYCCGPDDSVQKILQTMKEHQVRRIPIVSSTGKLEGIISLNDVILGMKKGDIGSPRDEEIVDTLKSICAHHSSLIDPQGKNATYLESAI